MPTSISECPLTDNVTTMEAITSSIIINAQNGNPTYGNHDRFMMMVDGLSERIQRALDLVHLCDHIQNQYEIIERIEEMEIAFHSLLNNQFNYYTESSVSERDLPKESARLLQRANRLEQIIISILQDNKMIANLSIIFEPAVMQIQAPSRAQSADAA